MSRSVAVWNPLVAVAGIACLAAACSGRERPVSARTVQGRVVNAAGTGLPAHEVRATTRSGEWTAPALTGADGAFTLRDVADTYDLAVTTSMDGDALVLVGLTRADPVVTFSPSADTHTPLPNATLLATANGDCGSTCPPVGQGGAFLCGFSGFEEFPFASWGYGLPVVIAAGIHVPTAVPVSGRMHALYWTCDVACGPAAVPLQYWHARSEPISVAPGDSPTVTLPDLAPVSSAAVQVDVVKPPGVAAESATVSVTPWFGPGISEHAVWDRSAAWGTTSFDVPDLSDLELTIGLSASNGPGLEQTSAFEHHLPPGTTRAAPRLRDAPILSAPAPGAAAGIGTRFAWTQDEGVSSLRIEFALGDVLHVVTARREAVWPDLSSFWIFGSPVRWHVRAFGPASTVDEVAVAPADGRRSSWLSSSALRTASAP